MRVRSFRPTIIIPTKNRANVLSQLLDSIEQLDAVDRILPEIIVADNDSQDDTFEYIKSKARCFRAMVRAVKVTRPGKSAAINDALKAATGDVVAFLDDDVVVDKNWLRAVEIFFRQGEYRVGQGMIQLPSPEKDEPEILKLVERYRTIPRLVYRSNPRTVHSLNGANFFVGREVFDRIGGFDERLGPGASGTSEDVDFARRLTRANIAIGYVPDAIVYHRVDRARLTEEYFKQSHRRQGASRFLIRNHSAAAIAFNLFRAAAGYGYYTVIGKERPRYRSKGRIYHYLGMINAKQNAVGEKKSG
ncbi:MAG: glycosyltransferase family 2 protein [Candidatus Binatia bacterium]